MASVQIAIPTGLRRYAAGVESERIETGRVREMLAELTNRHPALKEQLFDAQGALRRHVNIFVNGLDSRYIDGLDTTVAAGDDVQIVLAMAGG